MTKDELIGTAKVLRRQQEHAYSEGREIEGLEYAYRASLCEIYATRGINLSGHPEGTKPTNRGNRVRHYKLKMTDSEITRETRWANKQIYAQGFKIKPTLKPLPMFRTT